MWTRPNLSLKYIFALKICWFDHFWWLRRRENRSPTVLTLPLPHRCLCSPAGSISAAWATQRVKPRSGFPILCWTWPGMRASVLCVNRIQFTGRSYQLSRGETQPLGRCVSAVRARLPWTGQPFSTRILASWSSTFMAWGWKKEGLAKLKYSRI